MSGLGDSTGSLPVSTGKRLVVILDPGITKVEYKNGLSGEVTGAYKRAASNGLNGIW